LTRKAQQKNGISPKTKHSNEMIFDFFKEIIRQTFISGSFQGALPVPEAINIEAYYENGLLFVCFYGERQAIGEYSPLIEVLGTIMLQQPDCAYFKKCERNRYALCGAWASPSASLKSLTSFLKKILTPQHKVLSFSDRMIEQMVSFLSRNPKSLSKARAVFRIKR
jgi:hypothetical protein